MSDYFVEQWREKHSADESLFATWPANPIPVLDGELVWCTASERCAADSASAGSLALSHELIAELKAHDVIVILYRLQLQHLDQPKLICDLVARAGVTFRYTEERSGRSG
ncbi:hypothetical protein ACLK1T_28175 [Escherichia coli]